MVNKKTSNVMIKVENIHKSFRLPYEQHSGLKQLIINTLTLKGKRKRGYKNQQVLKGVSLEVNKGDFFGIVGRNGSGKSTLLKILAGIYRQNEGSVKINGSLVPFIELGVGFNPELTGRENVYLNGALLGFDKKQVEDLYDDIVEFAELEKFMDQKLKNYSSGMQVRLAFSIAIQAKSDILVLDEVLAVGDEAFQRKCNKYFEGAKKAGKTIVLVTHNMEAVRKYCNRAIFIKDGKIITAGSPEKVADEYSLENIRKTEDKINKKSKLNSDAFISAKITSSLFLKNNQNLELEISYKNINNAKVYPKIIFYYQNTPIMAANAKVNYGIVTSDTNEHKISYKLSLEKFNHGEVNVAVVLVDADNEINIASFGYNNELSFIVKAVKNHGKVGGIFQDLGKMELKK